MIVLESVNVKIPREEVLRLLKHNKQTTEIDQKTSDLVNSIIEMGRSLCAPKIIVRDYNVKGEREHEVELENCSYSLLGKSTAHHLWKAKKVTLFIATIGDGVDKKIKELTKQSSMAAAAILDTVGSVAVESVVNYINEETNNRARSAGYKTLRRFSPGYGDWDLKEQKGLLQLLNAGQMGVTLTNGNLMQPEKSVSGVIGWVKE